MVVIVCVMDLHHHILRGFVIVYISMSVAFAVVGCVLMTRHKAHNSGVGLVLQTKCRCPH